MGTSGDGARAEAGGFPARGRDREREGWKRVKIQVSQETRSNLPRESELPKPGINIPLSKGKGSSGD